MEETFYNRQAWLDDHACTENDVLNDWDGDGPYIYLEADGDSPQPFDKLYLPKEITHEDERLSGGTRDLV